ncbi:MAG: TetR/AcrR family transcriptional regulator [Proteobacteria bacterium]|nr:TetR/AcrR family transcriptional regulator [Pseudomonadota bacterium]
MVKRLAEGGMVVPELTARPRQGYARGAQGVEQILRKSEQLLIDEGPGALTLRRIAAECAMTQGNLSYYFKSKNDLLMALVEAIAQSYRTAARRFELEAGLDPLQKLRELVLAYMDNLVSKRTTRIFTELWALASLDDAARLALRGIYDEAIAQFERATGEANPALGATDRRLIALEAIAILEGHTVIIGHGMTYTECRDELIAQVCRTIEQLVLRAEPTT